VGTVDCEIGANLSAQMEPEDGYVNIKLIPKDSGAKNVKGSFLLLRSSNKDDYEAWKELYRFNMLNEFPNKTIWQDFTVQ
jgi:hypothetical protein